MGNTNEKVTPINKNLLLTKMSERGHNIRSLADETGVNRDTIGNIMSGKTLPSYTTMNAIFYALGLTADEGLGIFFPDYLRVMQVKELTKEL